MPRVGSKLKVAIICVLCVVALLFAGLAKPYVVLEDRWNQPTDFVEQFVALNRDHLHLGPDESASTGARLLLGIELGTIYKQVFGKDMGGTAPNMAAGVFAQDASPEELAQRVQLVDAYRASPLPNILDTLYNDPRVLATQTPLFDSADVHVLKDGQAALGDRLLSRILLAASKDSIQRDDLDDAVRQTCRMAAIIQASYSVPMPVDHLVGMANEMRFHQSVAELIETRSLSIQQLNALAAACKLFDGPDFEYMVRGDRLESMEMVRSRYINHWLASKDLRSQLHKIDVVYADLLSRADWSVAQWRAVKGRKFTDDWSAQEKRIYKAAVVLDYDYSKTAMLFFGVQAARAGTRTCIAVERYLADNAAAPPSLDALIPTYMASLPVDPFASAPLTYRVVAEREYMLYSVGADGEDNEGTSADTPEDALTDRERGTDFVVHPRFK